MSEFEESLGGISVVKTSSKLASMAVACALSTTVLTTPASAQLAIDRLWVDMGSGSVPRSDLVVRNESTDKYYITVSTSEILNPGTAEETRQPGSNPEELGLLVTPGRLILEPGQMRAIRLVSLNKGLARDRVYRVNVTPQLGEISATPTAAENRGLAIKLLAAFDVLVTVRPEKDDVSLTARRDGNFLTLSSAGNSNVLLLDGEVCPAAGAMLSQPTQDYILAQDREAHERQVAQAKEASTEAPPLPDRKFVVDACIGLPGRRLYSGNVWRLPAAIGEQLRFNRRDASSQDLTPIIISCDAAGNDGSSNSKYCVGANLEPKPGGSDTAPAISLTQSGES
jgi:P pilus assembly chaperone PapD